MRRIIGDVSGVWRHLKLGVWIRAAIQQMTPVSSLVRTALIHLRTVNLEAK